MNSQDLAPLELDLLIGFLRDQYTPLPTSSKQQLLQHALALLVIALEDELLEDTA
jgi:hypothetical protein